MAFGVLPWANITDRYQEELPSRGELFSVVQDVVDTALKEPTALEKVMQARKNHGTYSALTLLIKSTEIGREEGGPLFRTYFQEAILHASLIGRGLLPSQVQFLQGILKSAEEGWLFKKNTESTDLLACKTAWENLAIFAGKQPLETWSPHAVHNASEALLHKILQTVGEEKIRTSMSDATIQAIATRLIASFGGDKKAKEISFSLLRSANGVLWRLAEMPFFPKKGTQIHALFSALVSLSVKRENKRRADYIRAWMLNDLIQASVEMTIIEIRYAQDAWKAHANLRRGRVASPLFLTGALLIKKLCTAAYSSRKKEDFIRAEEVLEGMKGNLSIAIQHASLHSLLEQDLHDALQQAEKILKEERRRTP